MNILARFRAISDNDKAAVVRKLLESSTPDFDFFYLVGLSVLMAAFGLLLNSTSIVIGSMLLAPLMYPILGVALGLVMSNGQVLGRSVLTLIKSFLIGLLFAILAAVLFGDASMYTTPEIMMRTEPDLIHFMVAFIAGLAVSFSLGHPEWSETLPGIAISVALIPPLATIGVGIAALNLSTVAGATSLLVFNLFGIVFAAMISFSLMNLYQKQNIAHSTIKREEERLKEEEQAIKEQAKAMNNDVEGIIHK